MALRSDKKIWLPKTEILREHIRESARKQFLEVYEILIQIYASYHGIEALTSLVIYLIRCFPLPAPIEFPLHLIFQHEDNFKNIEFISSILKEIFKYPNASQFKNAAKLLSLMYVKKSLEIFSEHPTIDNQSILQYAYSSFIKQAPIQLIEDTSVELCKTFIGGFLAVDTKYQQALQALNEDIDPLIELIADKRDGYLSWFFHREKLPDKFREKLCLLSFTETKLEQEKTKPEERKNFEEFRQALATKTDYSPQLTPYKILKILPFHPFFKNYPREASEGRDLKYFLSNLLTRPSDDIIRMELPDTLKLIIEHGNISAKMRDNLLASAIRQNRKLAVDILRRAGTIEPPESPKTSFTP